MSDTTPNKCLYCAKVISIKAKYCSDKCRMAYIRSQPEQIKPEIKIRRDYLYIVQCKNDYYKIGYTSDTKERLVSMKTSNPFRLRLIFSTRFADPVSLEEYLHNQYKQYNVRGEWFKLTHQQVLDIVRFIVNWLLENPRV